eukprot:4189960-Lingulodinium_polyedra.AAC.1
MNRFRRVTEGLYSAAQTPLLRLTSGVHDVVVELVAPGLEEVPVANNAPPNAQNQFALGCELGEHPDDTAIRKQNLLFG